jgi:branched-chain amino acid transport system substrate-binding protein
LCACSQLDPDVASELEPDDGSGPIVVGAFQSLTGSEATFGQSTDRGIRMAIAEQNEAGGIHGRPIELVMLDDAGKTQEAGTAVTRLITRHHVRAVLGEVASGLSKAGGAVAQKYRVPMISSGSTNETVTSIGDMIFRVCFVDSFQGYVVARFAHDNLHATRVGILYDQTTPYSKGLATEFDRAFRALGGEVTAIEAYTGGDVDQSPQLQTLRDTSPQAIFVPGYYNDVGRIAQEARRLGITVPLLGGDGWDSPKLAEIGRDAVEGSYYSNHYSFEEQRPALQAFVDRFRARYGGQTPDALAALGYDSAKVLFAAMDRAPSLRGPELAAAIAATKDFHGVTGTITLDEHRDPVKSAVMLQIRDGKPHFAAAIEPPHGPLPEAAARELSPVPHASIVTKFLQTAVNALALGALYALLALGYTLVYGVLRFINFAHADVFTFGAWLSFAVASRVGSLWLTLGVAMAACALLGVAIERFAYRPLRRAPRLNVLITAIGVSLLLQNLGVLPWLFGPNPQAMPTLVADHTLATVAGVPLRAIDLVVVLLAVAFVAGLQWLVYRTRLGRAMRAVSYDESAAALMGIDVSAVITLTFAIGSALAAAAGLLFALKFESLQITAHSSWVLLGLTAFVAAVVGGIGDVRGAAVGGLLIAGVQEFGAAYGSTQLRDVYVFGILILVLLVKPSGLFGHPLKEKV